MDWWAVMLLIFGGLFAAMALGLPVAFSFLLINIIGVYFFWGGAAGLGQLVLSMYTSIASFTLLPIPLFILMGEVLFHSGVGLDVIGILNRWMGRLPGRLSLLSVLSGTLLSVMSGSSLATTAILGTTLTPEMERQGYKKSMILGPIMGSGTIAVMIPPSSQAVLIGAIGSISVAGILIGGIIPGLLMAFSFAAYIIIRCWLQPSLAPSYEVAPTPVGQKVMDTVKYVLPVGFIIFLVTGVIFVGVATPSEAAATGTLGSIILALFYRKLNWQVVKKSLMSTMNISIMVLMIITSSEAFSQVLSSSGASRGLVEFTLALPLGTMGVIIATQVIVAVLGGPIGPVSLVMITVPLFMPVVQALNCDPVWFGVLMLLNTEMAAFSPPLGSVLYVMKAVGPSDITMGDLYRSTIPFIACDIAVLALMITVPEIPLWLPGLMR